MFIRATGALNILALLAIILASSVSKTNITFSYVGFPLLCIFGLNTYTVFFNPAVAIHRLAYWSNILLLALVFVIVVVLFLGPQFRIDLLLIPLIVGTTLLMSSVVIRNRIKAHQLVLKHSRNGRSPDETNPIGNAIMRGLIGLIVAGALILYFLAAFRRHDTVPKTLTWLLWAFPVIMAILAMIYPQFIGGVFNWINKHILKR